MNATVGMKSRACLVTRAGEAALNLSIGDYSSIVRDDESGKIRLYYNLVADGGDYTALAESDDGITFTKPRLWQFPLPGFDLDNNLIAGLSGDSKHGRELREGNSIFVDSNATLGGRFVSASKLKNSSVGEAIGGADCGATMIFSSSADGVTWRDVGVWCSGNPGCDSQPSLLRDEDGDGWLLCKLAPSSRGIGRQLANPEGATVSSLRYARVESQLLASRGQSRPARAVELPQRAPAHRTLAARQLPSPGGRVVDGESVLGGLDRCAAGGWG